MPRQDPRPAAPAARPLAEYPDKTFGGGQPPVWASLMRLVGCPDLVDDPESAAPQARRPKLERVFGRIEQWRLRHAKFQAMERLHDSDVPRGPILDMEDKALAERGMIVEVPHPRRGTFKNVGCPIALSDSPMRVRTSPLLGEHTPEISPELLGYDAAQIAERRAVGAI